MTTATPATRDIIVIGGSSGALEALRTVVRNFEPDLPAAVCVVLHVGAKSHLESILAHSGPLPVTSAKSGGLFEHGKIHVAVPGFHLLLHDSHMLLGAGRAKTWRVRRSTPFSAPQRRHSVVASSAWCCPARWRMAPPD